MLCSSNPRSKYKFPLKEIGLASIGGHICWFEHLYRVSRLARFHAAVLRYSLTTCLSHAASETLTRARSSQ